MVTECKEQDMQTFLDWTYTKSAVEELKKEKKELQKIIVSIKKNNWVNIYLWFKNRLYFIEEELEAIREKTKEQTNEICRLIMICTIIIVIFICVMR